MMIGKTMNNYSIYTILSILHFVCKSLTLPFAITIQLVDVNQYQVILLKFSLFSNSIRKYSDLISLCTIQPSYISLPR